MPPKRGEEKPWRERYNAGDVALVVAGIALALICAVFPWYIFYNQDQFGIRALKFDGGAGASAGAGLNPLSRISYQPLEVPKVAPSAEELDALATGTLPSEDEARLPPPGPEDQPFPARPGDFRLIHVANGRAMIEDEHGLWIVRPGSVLPDNSRVASIEQRDGRWVLVTNSDRVVGMAE